MSGAAPLPLSAERAAQASPYKGLTPYTEADIEYFFGRETEIEIIRANLLASRLTLLYGESGVGKSSVLMAGVVHRLREEARRNLAERGGPEHAVAVLRSWHEDPVAALVAAAKDAVTDLVPGPVGGESVPGETMAEALSALAERIDGDLFLVLDQFEEYFVYRPDEDGPGTFAFELPLAVNRLDLRVNFLISIREDALARLDRFKGRIPALFDNRLRIRHLDERSARAAIVGPVDAYNAHADGDGTVTIEPELVDAVAASVGRVDLGQGRGDANGGRAADGVGDGRIEAPYLQLVMTRLWDEELRSGSRVLRAETLERCGGAEQIVRTRLDEAMTALPPDERDVAASVFRYLVTRSGSKVAHTASDLAEFAELPEPAVTRVVEHLAAGDVRVLRPLRPAIDTNGDARFEIFHDVLGPAVLDWRARYVESETRRKAEERHRRERRRTQIFAGLALLSALVAAAVAALAFWAVRERSHASDARMEARAQERVARAHELVARATAGLSVDPARSVGLAVEALEVGETPQAESELRRALSLSHVRFIVPMAHDEAAVAVSDPPARPLVAVASEAGSVRVVDAATGQTRATFEGHAGAVHAAAFNRNGTRLATAGSDGSVRLWSIAGGEVASRATGGDVYAIAFDPRGDHVAFGGVGPIWIWPGTDAGEPGRPTKASMPATTDEGFLTQIVFSPNGRRLATVAWELGTEETVSVWNVRRGRIARQAVVPAGPVLVAELDLAGSRLVTGGEARDGDAAVQVWDASTGTRLAVLERERRDIADVTFSRDGRFVATAEEKTARIWRTRTWERVAELRGHNDWVYSVEFRADANLVVTGSADRTARVWEAATGLQLLELRGHTDGVYEAGFAGEGDFVLTASADGTVRYWRASTGHELREHTDWVMDASFTPDGEFLRTVGADGDLYVWDVATGFVERELLDAHGGQITSIEHSLDGSMFVTASADETAQVRRAANGEHISTLEFYMDDDGEFHGHYLGLNSASFSPDGNRVVTASRDGTARVWNTRSGKEVTALDSGESEESVQTHDLLVSGAVYTADGRRIVTAGADGTIRDGTIRVWNAANGALLRTLHGHRGVVVSVAPHPTDPNLVVTGSHDGTARVWDVETGTEVAALSQPEGVSDVDFDPAGARLLTAGPSGVVRIWDWRSGAALAVIRQHADFVNSATFSPNGAWIASASDDRTAKLYRCETCVPLDVLIDHARDRLRVLERAEAAGRAGDS